MGPAGVASSKLAESGRSKSRGCFYTISSLDLRAGCSVGCNKEVRPIQVAVRYVKSRPRSAELTNGPRAEL